MSIPHRLNRIEQAAANLPSLLAGRDDLPVIKTDLDECTRQFEQFAREQFPDGMDERAAAVVAEWTASIEWLDKRNAR